MAAACVLSSIACSPADTFELPISARSAILAIESDHTVEVFAIGEQEIGRVQLPLDEDDDAIVTVLGYDRDLGAMALAPGRIPLATDLAHARPLPVFDEGIERTLAGGVFGPPVSIETLNGA